LAVVLIPAPMLLSEAMESVGARHDRAHGPDVPRVRIGFYRIEGHRIWRVFSPRPCFNPSFLRKQESMKPSENHSLVFSERAAGCTSSHRLA
jgi:hypothetical protein